MTEWWVPIVQRLTTEAIEARAVTYTVPQVADLLGLSEDRVWTAIDEQRISAVRVGRRSNTRLMPSEVILYLGTVLRPDPEVPVLRERLASAERDAQRVWDERPRHVRKVPRATREAVLARDGRRCRYCGRALLRREPLHVDHVVPRSRGGSDDPENLVVACVSCNTRKGKYDLEQCGLVLRPEPAAVIQN